MLLTLIAAVSFAKNPDRRCEFDRLSEEDVAKASTSDLRVQQSGTGMTLNGYPFQIENRGGATNLGLVHLKGPKDGLLLKLYNDETSDEEFGKFVEGNMVMASVGGPKITGQGIVQMPDGSKYRYVEMEDLGKGTDQEEWKPGEMDGLARKKALMQNHPQIAEKIADILVGALEQGIGPQDIDFVLSPTTVRPLDGDGWKRELPEQAFPRILSELNDHAIFDPEGVESVRAAMANRIRTSSLKPETRTRFTQKLAPVRVRR